MQKGVMTRIEDVQMVRFFSVQVLSNEEIDVNNGFQQKKSKIP